MTTIERPREYVPHDEDLERMFVGWLLQAHPEDRTRLLARIRPELFFSPLCTAYVRLFRDAALASADVDAVSVIRRVAEESGRERCVSAFAEMHDEWVELGGPGAALLDALEDYERQRIAFGIKAAPLKSTGAASLAAMRDSLAAVPDAVTLGTVGVMDVALDLSTAWDVHEDVVTLKTGLRHVDDFLGGFKRGDLVVVGARTSVGKSVFAMWLTRAILTTNRGVAALYDSLEMPPAELHKRILADEAEIENWRVQRGRFFEGERDRIAAANQRVGERGGLHYMAATGKWHARLAAYEQHCALYPATGLLVVDYIGLVSGVQAERRYQELGTITHDLKNLARRRNLVVVAVSQLNRSGEKDAAPQLSNLRESGDVEQDADVVLLLHAGEGSDAKRNHHTEPVHAGAENLTVIVAKNREGRLGLVHLDFVREYCRILPPATEASWAA